MRLDEHMVLAFCVAALIALAFAWWALLSEGGVQQRPMRSTYYPFTVEVEVWDLGASPWDHKDRPTDLDKM